MNSAAVTLGAPIPVRSSHWFTGAVSVAGKHCVGDGPSFSGTGDGTPAGQWDDLFRLDRQLPNESGDRGFGSRGGV